MTNDEAIKTLREDYCGNRIICELHPDKCNQEECEIWLAIKALEQKPCQDTISRQVAIDALNGQISVTGDINAKAVQNYIRMVNQRLHDLPSAQPEPLSDAYMKAVWTWLLDYQIKVAELKGRYTPYEVLSWVANDWRKEHE